MFHPNVFGLNVRHHGPQSSIFVRSFGPFTNLGLKTLATTSEAEAFENPKALQSNLKKLARLGCRHSRKVKGSKNRKKAARKLARMHARIAKIRQNALHQATTAIAKTKPCVIVLEDLNAKGL